MQTGKPSALFRRAASAGLAVMLVTVLSAASAEDAGLKDSAKRAGHTLGTAARDVGQGAKKAGKAVGNAAKEGGREFRRALKGESR
jgi:hypothetical protein